MTLVGTASYNYPINSIFLWTAGPQEAVLRVALKPGSGLHVEELKDQLRQRLPKMARKGNALPEMKDVPLPPGPPKGEAPPLPPLESGPTLSPPPGPSRAAAPAANERR